MIIILLQLLSACSSTGPYELNLMPAPEIYTAQIANPFTDEKSAQVIPYKGMLYATDRKPATGKDKDLFYANTRGHLLRLGVGNIQLEQGQLSWLEVKRISLLKKRDRDYVLRVTDVNELGILDSSHSSLYKTRRPGSDISADKVFADLVNEKLKTSQNKDIFVYIPGFKVVFSNPLLVAAELWHFLGYDGVFISYAWPSSPSRWAYAKDLETAAYTSHNLRLLLEYLARETDAHRIHIVAYSAGTRVAIKTLSQLALLYSGKSKETITEKLRIGQVTLIGSDYDRNVFAAHLEDGMLDVMENLNIYMSATDEALDISNFLFSRRRLGQVFSSDEIIPEVADFLQRTPNLNVIDVTNAENAAAGNGHWYFLKSPWVSSDILMTLKYKLKPQDRGLIRNKELPLWSFPDDYISQLRKNIEKKLNNQ
jgi:esterase/lipase superfamily enzyme